MPHTNRARRADHYRSIATQDNDNNNDASLGGHQPRFRKHHTGDAPERNAGDRAGRGGGRGDHGGREGPYRAGTPHSVPGRGSGADGRGEGKDDAGGVRGPPKTGGKKSPSVKNKIRSLTRLMNKPVSEWVLAVVLVGCG